MKQAIPITDGPLDGGSIAFPGRDPERFALSLPAGCGGPGEAVYVLHKLPGPQYRLVEFRDLPDKPKTRRRSK